MKCRLHSTDLSSAVGVCASCLRERLLLVISADQSQQTHQLQLYESYERRNSDPLPPPPLDFPRSVSPYVCRRKFDGVSLDFSDRRFHSTPQIGSALVSESMKKKKRGKFSFSFVTNLFKFRSDKSETDSAVGSKSKSVPKFVSQKIPITNQNHRVSDRGMSPERWPYNGEQEKEVEETSSRSSDSCEPTWKQTPVSTSTTKRRHSNISGLAFCLSPLVRASPNRNWSRNSLPSESGGGGSVIASRKAARLAVANSFCKNRSKKMADFGGVGGGGYDHRR